MRVLPPAKQAWQRTHALGNYKFALAPPNDPGLLLNVFVSVAKLVPKHQIVGLDGLECSVEAKTLCTDTLPSHNTLQHKIIDFNR